MAEPDHLFIRPLPNLATEDMPAAYKFFYIVPSENEKILRKFFPEEKGPISNIDPIGNSPVIIKKVLLILLLVEGQLSRLSNAVDSCTCCPSTEE